MYVGSCYQKIDGGVCQVCKLFVLSRLSPFELITEEAVENLWIKTSKGWRGEFVSQSRAALVGDHLLYSHDFHVWVRDDTVGRN